MIWSPSSRWFTLEAERALTDHLRLRIPGKGELTLSIPDGLIRALRENRLPAKVEVWHAEREEWVTLAAHPAAKEALESIGSFMPGPELAPLEELELIPPSEADVDAEVGAPEEPTPPPPDELIAPTEPPQPVPDAQSEFEELFASVPPLEPAAAPQPPLFSPVPEPPPSPPPPPIESHLDIIPAPIPHPPPRDESRTRGSRLSTAEPLPLPTEYSPPQRRFSLPRRPVLIAAVLVLGIGGYLVWKSRKAEQEPTGAGNQTGATTATRSPGVPAPAESVPAEAPPEVSEPRDGDDPAPRVAALELQGVPGRGPEADLETRLRLADAVMWYPAQDFGSQASVLRARRKVDAVMNSIQAYRVDMRRLADSAGAARLGNRMEPFDEADRIDDVIRTMGEAIGVLDDLIGRFSVQGGTLQFDRSEDARRYNGFRDRADSLLRAPVPMDLHPTVRPPRRLVTRLVQSLPGGIARGF